MTLRQNTLGRTLLDECSTRRRDLYLTTHNTYERHTSMPQARFEPTIPASERPQTHALVRADTETCYLFLVLLKVILSNGISNSEQTFTNAVYILTVFQLPWLRIIDWKNQNYALLGCDTVLFCR